MFRALFVLLLAAGIAGGVAYYFGMVDDYLAEIQPKNQKDLPTTKVEIDLGKRLWDDVKPMPPMPRGHTSTVQLAIDPCHVDVRSKQEVSSQKEGQLLFVGEPVLGLTHDQALQAIGHQMLIGLDANENIKPHRKRPVLGQYVSTGEVDENGKEEMKLYVYWPLEEGDVVDSEQVVAVCNPAIAYRDVESKDLKVAVAIADHAGTSAIYDETVRRLNKLIELRGQQFKSGIVSDVEIGDAKVSMEKYRAEEKVKRISKTVAAAELAAAKLVYDQHFLKSVKNQVPGRMVVQKIYKSAGESLKPQDPVMLLASISELLISGSVDSQNASTVQKHKDAYCFLEPSVEMKPATDLIKAHTAEVTCMAVCYDGKHFVSGGEDQRVCVWVQGENRPLRTLPHHTAVRSVACNPTSLQLLVGLVDGTIVEWDLEAILADTEKPISPDDAIAFEVKHGGPVNALAFSPDGKYFASGGEDNAIMLWNTADRTKPQYHFGPEYGIHSPHQGPITALQFTPQCTLVSAAKDNTIRVWDLHEKGAKLVGEPIAYRSGTVGQLGVSGDGAFLLFDKGRTLQLLSAADRTTVVSVLENLAGSNPFDTLAIFSPDASLMLTGGAGDGKLSLWKTPTPTERAFQVRELVTKDKAAITCAAFAPAGHNFAVTGSKEGTVQFWMLPTEEEIREHCIRKDATKQNLRLALVEQAVTAGKTRITANVSNPPNPQVPGEYRLWQGQRVTLVLEWELPRK